VPILSLNSSVYQKGVGKPAVLSVAGIPTIQRTLGPKANGLIVDLQLTLFSLLVPDLDEIPVAQRVRSVDVASVDAAPLLTFSEEHSCWPKLANVPSFDGRAKKSRIFVWPKSLVFCSFDRCVDTLETNALREL